MGRDAFESLTMSVFVLALMWFGASHGAAQVSGIRAVGEPSIAAGRDPGSGDSRPLQITLVRDPADAYSAGGYWDWMEGWAMP